jgi:hypothetical protein
MQEESKMSKTTLTVTLDDATFGRAVEALAAVDHGGKITSDTLGHRAISAVLFSIGQAARDGVSPKTCFKCRHARDLEGLANFPNGMDSRFAHEITDAIGMLREWASAYDGELSVGSDYDRKKVDTIRRLIKKLDDRVRIYSGIIQHFRDEEGRSDPPDGFEIVEDPPKVDDPRELGDGS